MLRRWQLVEEGEKMVTNSGDKLGVEKILCLCQAPQSQDEEGVGGVLIRWWKWGCLGGTKFHGVEKRNWTKRHLIVKKIQKKTWISDGW